MRIINTLECLREPENQKTLKKLGSRERGRLEKISAFNNGSSLEKYTVSKVMERVNQEWNSGFSN